MSARIGIINYGMGNLRSVSNAFEAVGATAVILSHPDDLSKADKVVLPGVGSFGEGMKNLREGGWTEALEGEVRCKGKPFLGLCLGMQLLATTGTEGGVNSGFGWVPGTVVKVERGGDLRVPHVGWNDVLFTKPSLLFSGLGQSATFYFVHSFVLRPDSPDQVTGLCSYGGDFTASIEYQNIYATQFHPEKSHRAGLAVLRNFLEAGAPTC
ncbi:MAG TPA: imidazole glycerol phosphate synthase subunit HisH [Blastocatellia bacterium]|nr:imidazole glycerol phosphate synthase subunit HisH [Blastocatellia bacterium]